jgi:two-component system KDP operon response regulator KdpE
MSTEPLILAVDDEPGILRLIEIELRAQGLRVITTGDAEDALRLAEEQRPDLVLLDILMPGLDGMELMRRLRERQPVPVVFLTAKDANADKVRGLEHGADDYVVKPFSPDELAARVRAVLRRATSSQDGERVVRSGNVEIDLDRRVVTRDGEAVHVTRTEWLLLQHLAANSDRVLLSAELLSKVWGPEYRDDLQYLRVWVSRLRRKLEVDPANPEIIQTRQGIGYVLQAKEAESVAAT